MIRFRKILMGVGILLLITLFLISCSSKGVEDFPFMSISDSAEDSDTVCEYSKYRIVISRLASGELLSVSSLLCEKIKDATGVYTSLCYDDEFSGIDESEWVIFVGNVDIDSVKETMRLMRSDDYMCRSFEDKTVIGGKNDSASVTAVQRFIDEILLVSNAQRLIPDGGGFEHFGEYAVKGLYIGGVSIGAFDIVVENDRDMAALQSAYILQDKISETFGYWLEVKSQKDPKLGKNICIYTDSKCQDGRAELEHVENCITLRAADRAGHGEILNGFFTLLCSDGTAGELHVTVPRTLYFYYGGNDRNDADSGDKTYEATQCKIAFVSLENLPKIGSANILTGIRETVYDYSPNVLLFGKVEERQIATLIENFKNYHNISDSFGCAFSSSESICSKGSVKNIGGVFCEVFEVRCGDSGFMLVYLSGSANDDIVIDISELTGKTELPTVAISYTDNNGNVTVVDSQRPFFKSIAEENVIIYEKTVSYKCYADVSHIEIDTGMWQNEFGLRGINVLVF